MPSAAPASPKTMDAVVTYTWSSGYLRGPIFSHVSLLSALGVKRLVVLSLREESLSLDNCPSSISGLPCGHHTSA
jgi:hypothetical protein